MLRYPFADGGDVDKLMLNMLKRQQSRDAVFYVPDSCVWFYVWCIALALKECFEGKIMHNDIKLPNVLYDNDKNVFMLTDFGLSCHSTDKQVPFTCSFFAGTPDYIAPEVFSNYKRSWYTDIWSFGITIWEIAIGRL